MLVLTRKPGEIIKISDNISIMIVRVQGDKVRIGIEAPRDVHILRGEIKEWRDPGAADGGDDS